MPKVKSKDGTPIAYERQGTGPALILVDGALGYRALGFGSALVTLLAADFTVYAYDRRGRGESGDTQPYAVAREVEDIKALIDAAGGSAYLYGISSGAALAFEAALQLQDRVKALALYEPPYDSSPEGQRAFQRYRQQLADFLAQGRRGDAVALFMSFVGTPADMVAGMRQSPMWPMFEAAAPTLAYDAACLGPDRSVPTDRAAAVSVPTLVMNGDATLPFIMTTAEMLANAIPGAEHRTLVGQRHDVSADVLAPVLVEFFSAQPGARKQNRAPGRGATQRR